MHPSIIVFQSNIHSFWKLHIVQSKIENIFEEQDEIQNLLKEDVCIFDFKNILYYTFRHPIDLESFLC